LKNFGTFVTKPYLGTWGARRTRSPFWFPWHGIVGPGAHGSRHLVSSRFKDYAPARPRAFRVGPAVLQKTTRTVYRGVKALLRCLPGHTPIEFFGRQTPAEAKRDGGGGGRQPVVERASTAKSRGVRLPIFTLLSAPPGTALQPESIRGAEHRSPMHRACQ